MKKLLCCFAILALSAVMFASCAKKTANTHTDADNKTDADIHDDEFYTSDLSTDRYDGYNYRILVRKGKMSDQYFAESQADVVDAAVYKRNKSVEERYGITITAYESSNSNAETDAINAIQAGDDAYDVIFPHTGSAFSYATKGAVMNINDISSIHLDKPWWSKDIVDSYNVIGYLYTIDGDISTFRLSNTMCLFFNKRIFDELGIEYPYDLVNDGTWTFDKFSEIVKKGGKDLDGDGIMTPENDQYGFFANEFASPINILYAGGGKIYGKNDSGALELTLYTQKNVDIFDKYFELMDSDDCFIQLSGSDSNYSGGNAFVEGRACFADGTLGYAKNYRSMSDEFGIIPYPKFDENDDYHTVVNGFAHTVVIPITVSDPERTGAITEALCAYGSKEVLPAFYEQALKTKYSHDKESEEMIDIIRDSIVYDVGYASGGPFTFCGYTLAHSAEHNFSSFYAANESSAEFYLKQFNESYGHIK